MGEGSLLNCDRVTYQLLCASSNIGKMKTTLVCLRAGGCECCAIVNVMKTLILCMRCNSCQVAELTTETHCGIRQPSKQASYVD